MCFICGSVIALNALCVYVLLHGSNFELGLCNAFFSTFKLVRPLTVTPCIFEYEFFYFGASAEHHESVIRPILGGKTARSLIVHVVAPCFTTAVVDPNCSDDYFCAVLEISVNYEFVRCLVHLFIRFIILETAAFGYWKTPNHSH